jgi:hypothetical protein
MIRVLRVARRGAMKARIQAGAQLDALIVTAPEQVRAPLRKLTSKQRVRACAALRPGPVSDPASAVKMALWALARRWQVLQAEIDDLDVQLTPLVTAVAPGLLALPGVGLKRYIAREVFPHLLAEAANHDPAQARRMQSA